MSSGKSGLRCGGEGPMKLEARVSSGWRVTVPASIRKRLNLQPKDTITFTLKPDGTLILRVERKTVS